jgi:DUF971 family protein
MPLPVDIAHAPAERRLTITWDDGVVDELPAAYLRAWCPCATCQGHGHEVRWLAGHEDRSIVSLHEIGAYALGVRFDDGHDTGLYTWQWLRTIGPSSPPHGWKRGTWTGGRFIPAP